MPPPTSAPNVKRQRAERARDRPEYSGRVPRRLQFSDGPADEFEVRPDPHPNPMLNINSYHNINCTHRPGNSPLTPSAPHQTTPSPCCLPDLCHVCAFHGPEPTGQPIGPSVRSPPQGLRNARWAVRSCSVHGRRVFLA